MPQALLPAIIGGIASVAGGVGSAIVSKAKDKRAGDLQRETSLPGRARVGLNPAQQAIADNLGGGQNVNPLQIGGLGINQNQQTQDIASRIERLRAGVQQPGLPVAPQQNRNPFV